MTSLLRTAVAVAFVFLADGALVAQYVAHESSLTELPREHAYQRTLREYLATLTEKDFAVDPKAQFTVPPPAADVEDQYRLWLLTLSAPHFQAAAIPPAAFTLRTIEGRKSLTLPTTPNSCQGLAWLATWDFSGNPHRDSAAIKRRAFVLAAVDLVMIDHLQEHGPASVSRSDFLGGNLIWIGYTYKQVNSSFVTAPSSRIAL